MSNDATHNVIFLTSMTKAKWRPSTFIPFHAKVSYLNFHPLKVVARYRDPQIQVGENDSNVFILRPDICKSDYKQMLEHTFRSRHQ